MAQKIIEEDKGFFSCPSPKALWVMSACLLTSIWGREGSGVHTGKSLLPLLFRSVLHLVCILSPIVWLLAPVPALVVPSALVTCWKVVKNIFRHDSFYIKIGLLSQPYFGIQKIVTNWGMDFQRLEISFHSWLTPLSYSLSSWCWCLEQTFTVPWCT